MTATRSHWPATATALAALMDPERGIVVPGHGDHAGVEFALAHATSFTAVADLGRRVVAGEITLDDAVAEHPFPDFPVEEGRPPIERAIAQLEGTFT